MNTNVVLNFNDGSNNYDFPTVYSISDPEAGAKDTVIEGNRGDGSIVIPGGKRSSTISIKGVLVNHAGYAALTTDIGTMRSNVTNSVATLTLKHWTGATWQNDWSYTVKREGEIRFPESLRTDFQEYSIDFRIISY
jgi:hypothetical protein